MQDNINLSRDESWPPPPTGQAQIAMQAKIETYLVSATLDTILGLVIGIVSYCVVCFAVTKYILYYVIPFTVRSQWNFLIGALLALLIMSLVWVRLRSYYSRMANSFMIGAAIPATALLILVRVVW